MNVYDFDNTIYDGESVFDFYLFCLRSQPRLVKYLFVVVTCFIKYKFCLMTVDDFIEKSEKYALKLLYEIDDLEGKIKKFWQKNAHKIKPFYALQHKPDDVVISASFDFLIEDICRELGIKNLVSSEIDRKTGELLQLCYRKNKTELFKHKFGDAEIDNFYTDSKNDIPMMKLAKNTFLVKGLKIKPYNKYSQPQNN